MKSGLWGAVRPKGLRTLHSFAPVLFVLLAYRISTLLFVGIPALTGCVAAPFAVSYAMTAGVIGYSSYSVYKLSKDSTAKFEIERNDPDIASQRKIKDAKSIAIYPAKNGQDGEYVDIFRNKTDMKVVSSSQTISYLEKKEIPNLMSLPRNERIQAMARLGRANGADITITGVTTSPIVEAGVFTPGTEITYEIQVSLVDTREEKELWQENQKIIIDGIQKMPSEGEIYKLMAAGAADRLMDIRRGSEAKSTAEKDGFFNSFECGGKYNPFCEESSRGEDEPVTVANSQPEPKNDELVRGIQAELGRLGYYRGTIDGQYGPRTKAAITDFQRENGLNQNGQPTQKLLKQIEGVSKS